MYILAHDHSQITVPPSFDFKFVQVAQRLQKQDRMPCDIAGIRLMLILVYACNCANPLQCTTLMPWCPVPMALAQHDITNPAATSDLVH